MKLSSAALILASVVTVTDAFVVPQAQHGVKTTTLALQAERPKIAGKYRWVWYPYLKVLIVAFLLLHLDFFVVALVF
jgi:hypothetical protein